MAFGEFSSALFRGMSILFRVFTFLLSFISFDAA